MDKMLSLEANQSEDVQVNRGGVRLGLWEMKRGDKTRVDVDDIQLLYQFSYEKLLIMFSLVYRAYSWKWIDPILSHVA